MLVTHMKREKKLIVRTGKKFRFQLEQCQFFGLKGEFAEKTEAGPERITNTNRNMSSYRHS